MTVVAELLGDYLRLVARLLSDDAVTAVLVAAATIVLIIGILGTLFEVKDKRAAEAIAVQGEIVDALLRERVLNGLSLTPTARARLWRGSPVIVRVTGEVPSRELRRVALRAAERGAAKLLVRVRIKSRIRVVRSRRGRRHRLPLSTTVPGKGLGDHRGIH